MLVKKQPYQLPLNIFFLTKKSQILNRTNKSITKFEIINKDSHEIEAETTSDELVQNLDFAQTFLEAAGIEAPSDMQGKSPIPLLKGHAEKWNIKGVYYHYYEYPAEHAVKRHYGISTKEYKLIHFYYDIDEWELYDLKKDPNEMNNVYNNPAYHDIVNKLKTALKEMRIKYKDSPELDKKFIESYKKSKSSL